MHPLRAIMDYAGRSALHRATVLLGGTAAVLGGAWFIELALGYAPCKLCLIQRWPYYAALPLAVMAMLAAAAGHPRAARPAFAMLGLVFMVSVALGAHHAGVEWGWWPGPTDCGGRLQAGPENVGDLLSAMETTRVINCADAPFRVLGLSLAGWNALLSFGLAVLAIRGWRRPEVRAV
jgi:disulfide bond formation protein DsbB